MRKSLLFERLSSIRRDFLFVLFVFAVGEVVIHPLDVLFRFDIFYLRGAGFVQNNRLYCFGVNIL